MAMRAGYTLHCKTTASRHDSHAPQETRYRRDTRHPRPHPRCGTGPVQCGRRACGFDAAHRGAARHQPGQPLLPLREQGRDRPLPVRTHRGTTGGHSRATRRRDSAVVRYRASLPGRRLRAPVGVPLLLPRREFAVAGGAGPQGTLSRPRGARAGPFARNLRLDGDGRMDGRHARTTGTADHQRVDPADAVVHAPADHGPQARHPVDRHPRWHPPLRRAVQSAAAQPAAPPGRAPGVATRLRPRRAPTCRAFAHE